MVACMAWRRRRLYLGSWSSGCVPSRAWSDAGLLPVSQLCLTTGPHARLTTSPELDPYRPSDVARIACGSAAARSSRSPRPGSVGAARSAGRSRSPDVGSGIAQRSAASGSVAQGRHGPLEVAPVDDPGHEPAVLGPPDLAWLERSKRTRWSPTRSRSQGWDPSNGFTSRPGRSSVKATNASWRRARSSALRNDSRFVRRIVVRLGGNRTGHRRARARSLTSHHCRFPAARPQETRGSPGATTMTQEAARRPRWAPTAGSRAA